MTTTLTRGTQILYVPMHAQGDTNHPDVEPGFVTSQLTGGIMRTCARNELV